MHDISQAPQGAAQDSAQPAVISPIRVILADTQPIYRIGIRKILALEDDIRVVAQAETLAQTIKAVQKFPAEVILFEAALSGTPAESITAMLRLALKTKIVVVVEDHREPETVEYLRRGAGGTILRTISPDLLVRCIRKVAAGETWLDSQGVNWVIEAYRTQAEQLISPRTSPRLAEKELLIVARVTQGMKNKDIAQEIGTSEQVVKNYLRKVYDKLGVSDRLELALYSLHHRLLERAQSAVTAASEADADAAAATSAAGSSLKM